MNRYIEMKSKNEKIFNDFANKNMFFAFSDKQLKEGIAKFKDGSKFYNLGAGSFLLKEKLEDYKNLNENLNLKHDLLKDDDLLLEAFVYELGNHEYCITYSLTETLESLDLSEEYKTNDKLKTIMKKAIDIYLQEEQK